MLKLVQPTAGVFDTWFRESTDRQAEDRAWALGGDVETHRAQVSAMIPQLLPDGKDTPGHTFRIAQTEEGTDIAFVWFGTVPGMPSNARLLFDVYVAPEQRRKGYARTILTRMLAEMSAEGVEEVSLHARGDNVPALTLYESLGFTRTETSSDGKQVQMRLGLRQPL